MVEESVLGVAEHHTVFIRRLDALRVHYATTRRGKVFHPTFPRPMDVIREGEERITGTGHIIELGCPLLTIVFSQRRRDALEQSLPLSLLTALEHLTTDIKVDCVGFVGALDTLVERECENLGMVAEPP